MAVSILHGESFLDETEKFGNKNLLVHKIFEQLLSGDDPSLADKCAVFCQDRTQTYGQLNALANKLARTLTSRIQAAGKNLSDGPKLIGVCLPPSERLVAVLLAILKCGGAYLPLDASFPPTRLQHILTEAKPLLVILEGFVVEGSALDEAVNYADLIREGMTHNPDDLSEDEGLWRLGQNSDSHVACVLYTSGSTGVPKGVVLPHKVILNRLRWQWRTFPFQDNEICCFKTVLTFVDSVAEIFAPLLRGHQLVVVPRCVVQDPTLLVAELEKRGVHRLVLVPSLLRALLTFAKAQDANIIPPFTILPQLKLWVAGGEPLSERLLHEFFLAFPHGRTICNFYGSTEVMADVTYATFTSLDDVKELVLDGKVPIGLPVDNTNVYALDEGLQPVSLGEMGEIYVSGFNVAAGYLRQAEKSDERFLLNAVFPGPGHGVLYRTGDFGRVINGQLYYEGRTDSQVKVRGQRVDLTEIQRAAHCIYGIGKAVVLCYQPGEAAQSIVLFYLPLQNDTDLTEAQVTSELHQHLASYMMPCVVKMESIPLLHNGKVDRQSLLRHFEEMMTSSGHSSIDFSGVEEEELEAAMALLTVTAAVIHSTYGKRWCAGSKTDVALTVDANFFEVGGNSLNALEVLGALRDRGYHVSVADFLQAPTLRRVLHKITFDAHRQKIEQGQLELQDIKSKYSFLELQDVSQAIAIQLAAQSFANRGELELLSGASVEDMFALLEAWWPAMMEARLSFAVQEIVTKEIVAVSLNFDVHNEPVVEAPPRIKCIFDFLEAIERPSLLNVFPPGPGTVMHAALLGTDLKLTAAENIHLVQLIEEHNIQVAQNMGYKVVFTSNTSPVTKDICQELFGYQTLNDVQVNQHVDKKGLKVFEKAPDSLHVYVAAKFL